MRYSNIAFEMLGVIALFTFIGYQLDKWVGTNKPWFTVVCSIVSVGISVYYAIKNFIKPK